MQNMVRIFYQIVNNIDNVTILSVHTKHLL